MTDLHGPRDLHHRLIEKTVQIGGFACSAAEIDQDPHVPADFFQFQRLLTCDIVHPRTNARHRVMVPGPRAATIRNDKPKPRAQRRARLDRPALQGHKVLPDLHSV